MPAMVQLCRLSLALVFDFRGEDDDDDDGDSGCDRGRIIA